MTVPVELTVIEDTQGPILDVVEKVQLWPPNHKYHTLSVADLVLGVLDNCDGPIDASQVRIEKVTSDEADNSTGRGDGNTINDIVQTVEGNCQGGGNALPQAGSREPWAATALFGVDAQCGVFSSAGVDSRAGASGADLAATVPRVSCCLPENNHSSFCRFIRKRFCSR